MKCYSTHLPYAFHHRHLDDVAHPKGIIEVPHCLLHVPSTEQALVVAIVVGVCACAKVSVSS